MSSSACSLTARPQQATVSVLSVSALNKRCRVSFPPPRTEVGSYGVSISGTHMEVFPRHQAFVIFRAPNSFTRSDDDMRDPDLKADLT